MIRKNENRLKDNEPYLVIYCKWASQVALVVKNLPASVTNVRDVGSIPGPGRSPGGGHGTHSNILAWRIPWTEEPGRP